MKVLILFGFFALYSCTPEAKNLGTLDPESTQTTPESETTPPQTTEPEKLPQEELQLKGCSNAEGSVSDHKLSVLRDLNTGNYEINFADSSNQKHAIISLYVTDINDEIPTFKNNFKFSGTAYWMISVNDPFEESFHLPINYGTLPNIGIDVTEKFKGLANGALLYELKQPTCIKISVISFEPDEQQAFKTSTYLQAHRP